MQVKLTEDEKRTIIKALDIARIFYEKTKRKEDYLKVDGLADILFFEKEITVILSDENAIYYTDDAKKLGELLEERAARLKAEEQGCKVYQLKSVPEGPVDPDDPDEVEADKYFRSKMIEIAKEHPEIE